MKHPIFCFFGITTIPKEYFPDQDVVTILLYEDDINLQQILHEKQPDVIISIGTTWNTFKNLTNGDLSIRKKWLHFNKLDDVKIRSLYYCYISNLINNNPINNNPSTSLPLISVFTPSYKSGDKILRPFRSLKAQSYPHWEWIIISDSPDDIDSWNALKLLKEKDNRIKVYCPDMNTANIGQLKFTTASMARGDYLVELDHDDDLTPDCFKYIIDAFEQFPEAGFVYTDFAELYEKDLTPFQYGATWAFDYGGYYSQKTYIPGIGEPVLNWVATSINLNSQSIRHIVGVPNHIRAWKKTVYQELGGHYPLPVADDYELLVRTFLKTRMVHIPYLGYYQYRNLSGNTTFRRNSLITMLQSIVKDVYEPQIKERLKELGIIEQTIDKPIWEQPYNFHESHATLQYLSNSAKNTISVIVSTYKRPELLQRAINSILKQTYQDFEILVVGDNCPNINLIMNTYSDKRIRWWNLHKSYNDCGATPKNYALRLMVRTPWIAYLDDDNYWLPNHLESLISNIHDSKFAFSSFIMTYDPQHALGKDEIREYTIICQEPKLYRIDTSCIFHHKDLLKYGYWRPIQDVYANDWELVSRWVDHGEKWVATKLPTLMYNADPSKVSAKGIYEWYGGQLYTECSARMA